VNDGYRSKLLRWITFLSGLYFFLEFLLPVTALQKIGVAPYHDMITKGFITVGAMSIGLGIVNLLLVHGTKIAFRRKGWINSTALLMGMVLAMVFASLEWRGGALVADGVREISVLGQFAQRIHADEVAKREGVPPLEERMRLLKEATISKLSTLRADVADEPDTPARRGIMTKIDEVGVLLQPLPTETGAILTALQRIATLLSETGALFGSILREKEQVGTAKKVHDFLYNGLFTSLGAAMFSLLSVYIGAAAFRAFRVRSFESFLMMGAAVLVMLGQTPYGLMISDALPHIRLWLLEVPNSAAFRAIKIGASVAALVMAFRMWLSIESESFARDRE